MEMREKTPTLKGGVTQALIKKWNIFSANHPGCILRHGGSSSIPSFPTDRDTVKKGGEFALI